MGPSDAVNNGLDAPSLDLDRVGAVLDHAVWSVVKPRAGAVLDSRLGTVRWDADDTDRGFDIVGADLPPGHVPYRLQQTTARIGERAVELQLGKQGTRRSSWSADATLDEVTYRLRQRGSRLAEIERDGSTVAVLARPRKGPRLVNWARASVSGEELTLGHCLAAYAEIGARGWLYNSINRVSP